MISSAILESRRLFRQGKLAERAGNLHEAKRLLKQGLILDPMASQADWDLLDETPRIFRERRALYHLLAIRIEEMARKVGSEMVHQRVTDGFKPKVFMYWGQGFSSAPPIVRACYAEAQRLHDMDEIVFLDDSNIHEWVDLPQSILDISMVSRAAFSDVLRFELLAAHGGIWMDATCMPMQRLQDLFPTMVSGSGFFAFRRDKPGLRPPDMVSARFL